MDHKEPKEMICQSCSMPMAEHADFGTNANGSISDIYCHICFMRGRFVDPDISMEHMIDNVSKFVPGIKGIPKSEARKITEELIPKLKRWAK